MDKRKNQSGIPAPEFKDVEQDPKMVSKIEVGATKQTPQYTPEDWEIADPTEVRNKNPKLQYRWVSHDKQALRKRQGYEVIKKVNNPSDGDTVPTLAETQGSAYVLGGGDNVLMAMDKEKFQRRKAWQNKDAIAARNAVRKAQGKAIDMGPEEHANEL